MNLHFVLHHLLQVFRTKLFSAIMSPNLIEVIYNTTVSIYPVDSKTHIPIKDFHQDL